MSNRFIFVIILTLMSGVFCVFSQDVVAEDNQKQAIILQYADSLVGTRGPNMEIREFVGNVVLIQGDVIVKCNRAVQYLQANKAVLSGDVHINQKELNLYTSEGVYYGNAKIATTNTKVKITDGKTTLTAGAGTYSTMKRIADFRNDVKIEDDSVIIYSDRLIYHKDNKNSYAYGNVLLRGKYTETYLLGDTVEHFPGENITYVKGNPRLFRIDTIESRNEYNDSLSQDRVEFREDLLDTSATFSLDTLSVRAEFMKSVTDKESNREVFYFFDSVEIRKQSLAARADTAVYDKTEGIIKLIGMPVVWYDSTQLYSDSIIIEVPDMKIKKLRAIGNAIACSRDDSTNLAYINQVLGDEIIINFENDSINTIFSFGNAKSLYFLQMDTTGAAGLQRSSCDSITVFFEANQVSTINWLGGISGEFHPSHLIDSPEAFYLPRFKWTDVKPKKITLRITRKD